MPTSDPVAVGGSTGGAALELGGHQVGAPFRTAWDAVAPPGSGGSPSFVWRQEVPQSVVTIEHGLGFRPAGVSVFSLDFQIEYEGGVVQHLDENTLRLSMDDPTAVAIVLS